MFYTGINIISSPFNENNEVINQFHLLKENKNKVDPLLKKALNEGVIIEPFTFNSNITDVEKQIESNPNTHNSAMFLTHTFDAIELLNKLSLKYKTPLVYDFFEEGNEFLMKVYFYGNGKYITVSDINDFEKEIPNNINDSDELFSYLSEKIVYPELQKQDLESIIEKNLNKDNYKNLKELLSNNSYDIFYKKNLLVIRLVESFAMDSLLYIEDNIGIQLGADTMFNYIYINLFETYKK